MKLSNAPESKLSPKAISLNRLHRSKLMKVLKNEGNFVNNENIIKPIDIKHTPYKIHDRNIKDELGNGFCLPDYHRIFTKSIPAEEVRKEPFIMSEPKTICDIDPTFYKLVEGRPLRSFIDVKVYIKTLREITLFRTNTALMKQQIILIDTKHNEEVEKYNKILKLCDKTKLNFIKFTQESFEIAKTMQERADLIAERKAFVEDQLEKVYFRHVKIRNKIFDVYNRYCTLLRYKKFLLLISPISWQAEFYPSHYDKNEVDPQALADSTIELPNSDSMMSVYKEYVKHFEPPFIYFKSPEQLIILYENLRLQCLNYIQIDVITSKMLKSLLSSRDTFKQNMTISYEGMLYFIEAFERKITFLEERADCIKILFFKILNSEFKKLYASYDAFKLFNSVQYVHKKIFGGHEEPRDDLVTLMSEIEREYIKYTLELDGMDQGIVKTITNKLFTDEIKKMNRAYKANRILTENVILRKSLYASFEPPRQFRPRLATRK